MSSGEREADIDYGIPPLGAGLKLKTKEGNRPVDKIDDSVVLGVELFEERCSIYLKLNIITYR